MTIPLDDVRTAVSSVDSAPAQAFAQAFTGFLDDAGDSALDRSAGPEHVTASCLVIDPTTGSVLLDLHRKAQRWVQFGGHLEASDASVREAARREAEEESGLAGLEWFSPDPVGIHIHDLEGDFGSCRTHYDVVYAATASVSDAPVVSDESLDVRWFSIGDLPDDLMPDLISRLPELYRAALAAHRTAG